MELAHTLLVNLKSNTSLLVKGNSGDVLPTPVFSIDLRAPVSYLLHRYASISSCALFLGKLSVLVLVDITRVVNLLQKALYLLLVFISHVQVYVKPTFICLFITKALMSLNPGSPTPMSKKSGRNLLSMIPPLGIFTVVSGGAQCPFKRA